MFNVARLLIALAGASVVAVGSGAVGSEKKAAIYSKEQCGSAPRTWQRQGSEFGELMTFNLLEVRQNRLFWNDTPINEQTLRRYLVEMLRLNPAANMVLVIDPLSTCSEIAALRQAISARLRCGSEQACVEYAKADWKKRKPPWRR